MSYNEAVDFGKKIMNYKAFLAIWRSKCKNRTREDILLKIELLNSYWDTYQTCHNSLIKQAELNPKVLELEYVKNIDQVNKQYTDSLKLLNFMLKLTDPNHTESSEENQYGDDSSSITTDSQQIYVSKNSENHETYTIDESDEETCKDEGNLSLSLRKRRYTSSTDKSPKRRRKTSHKAIRDDDDNITFEICLIQNDEYNGNGSMNRNTNDDESYVNEEVNFDLIRTIAFLRSSASYILLRLGYKPFEFRKTATLPWLMSEYYEKKNASKRKTLFAISSETLPKNCK